MPSDRHSGPPGQDWAAITRDYAANTLPVRELCQLHGVSRDALYRRAHEQGWPLRSQAPRTTAPKARPAEARPHEDGAETGSPSGRAGSGTPPEPARLSARASGSRSGGPIAGNAAPRTGKASTRPGRAGSDKTLRAKRSEKADPGEHAKNRPARTSAQATDASAQASPPAKNTRARTSAQETDAAAQVSARTKKTPSRAKAECAAANAAAGAPRKQAAKSRTQRPLAERLHVALERKIGQLEGRLRQAAPATAADGAREARTLAMLVTLFEKMEKHATGTGPSAGSAPGELIVGEGLNADRIRRELAQRLEALRVTLAVEPCPAWDAAIANPVPPGPWAYRALDPGRG